MLLLTSTLPRINKNFARKLDFSSCYPLSYVNNHFVIFYFAIQTTGIIFSLSKTNFMMYWMHNTQNILTFCSHSKYTFTHLNLTDSGTVVLVVLMHALEAHAWLLLNRFVLVHRSVIARQRIEIKYCTECA